MDAHAKAMSTPEPLIVDHQILDAVSNGLFYNPHFVLGAHVHTDVYKGYATVRVLKPLAKTVTILTREAEYEATHEWNGIFTAVIPVKYGDDKSPLTPDYRVRTTYQDGTSLTEDDPYRFLPTLGQMDVYLIGEGRHERLWEVLGAHVRTFSDPMGSPDNPNSTTLSGVAFAVWAPSARMVRIVGDFDDWDGRPYAMRSMGSSGLWELFIPGLTSGQKYKYQILNANNEWKEKSDPLESYHEIPPRTASVVYDSTYQWHDDQWMQQRASSNPHMKPLSIYEVHAGSWKKGYSYRQMADDLVAYVKRENFTHVEFLPLAQHPFAGSWGYQVTGYYAPDSRFGDPDDFRYLVDAFHQEGIGVILDWVPAHFPKDDFALARFDGTPLYEDPDPLRGEHPDWGTYIFNYGRNEVRNFLVANAIYWLKEFHADGLRVDAVASMLYLDYSRENGQWRPNRYGGRENLEAIDFLKEATATAYKNNPGTIIIAEESTAWPGITAPTSSGGLGFGLKWNMGWMHDTLEYFQEQPLNRKWHHNEITFSMVYAYTEHYVLPISHDEVVHGKGSLIQRMPGSDPQRFAQVRELFAYQWSHPGRKLTFMGNEIAQFTEWDDNHSLDWVSLNSPDHRGVQTLVADLNELYRTTPALWEKDFEDSGFEWLTSDDADHNTLSFMRVDNHGNPLVAVINFSGAAWHDYQVPLPLSGGWREVLTTDDEKYNGSGVHNENIIADAGAYHSRNWSAKISIPAFSAIFLKPED
ncbi:MAG: 1,4-alpha-glucan branching protein GlgB [Bifidobacteriaceae bacterium]|jgi:1,4-alpha-glucan branching enzyme|nr:1,4-alpha-glucan branching protein GlgB [Bifidobacteriaceae bacterium]MCI1914541.1 1,4-alpha-glucan branching protein GlgB [Bifidobacteriaceae bacterium]